LQGAQPAGSPEGDRAFRGVAIALAVALLASVMWLSTGGSPAKALRGLPPQERAGVVHRALDDLRDVCQRTDRPRDFCRAQAELVRGLPECDEACQTVASEELRADGARR
jgi:hypothetical protein